MALTQIEVRKYKDSLLGLYEVVIGRATLMLDRKELEELSSAIEAELMLGKK